MTNLVNVVKMYDLYLGMKPPMSLTPNLHFSTLGNLKERHILHSMIHDQPHNKGIDPTKGCLAYSQAWYNSQQLEVDSHSQKMPMPN